MKKYGNKNSESLNTNTLKKNIIGLNKNDFKKIKVIIFIIVILIIFISGIFILKTNPIKKEEGETKKEETTSLDGISYRILDNTEEDIKGVVILNYSEGIQTIEYSDDLGKIVKLNCNGKEKVAIDKKVKLNQDYIFKITTPDGEKNETLRLDQSSIDEYVKISLSETDSEYDKARVDFYNEETVTKYYKIGNDNKNWKKYNGEIDISYIEYADNDIVTVYAKEVDTKGNTIINNKEISITPTKKRKMNIFDYINKTGITLNEFGFSNTSKVNCEGYAFSSHRLLAGHGTGSASYSAIFKLDCEKINTLDFEQLRIKFVKDAGYTIEGQSTAYSSVTLYYKDGESKTKQATNVMFDIQNKDIDYIEMKLWGYDAEGSSSTVYVKDIILEGIQQPINLGI